MTETLRRLDDGTRYYSLTWRQWAAALTGGGLLYLAVRFSPLSAEVDVHRRAAAARDHRRGDHAADRQRPRSGPLPRRDRALDPRTQALPLPRVRRQRAARRCRAAAPFRSRSPTRSPTTASTGSSSTAHKKARGDRRGPPPARRAPTGRRVGPLDALIDIAALEPDGLIVTTDGTYVRIIDCDFVPNPITADPSDIATIEAGWASIFAAIPDHQAPVAVRADRPDPDRRRDR